MVESAADKIAGRTSLTIETTPSAVDAGAEFGLHARAVCEPLCDITGLVVIVRDADGNDVGQIEFTAFDGETSTSGDLMLTAPLETGTHLWSAVLPDFDSRDATYAEVAAPVTIEVRPHPITVITWGVTPAVADGETAGMHVGIRCSCGCALAGRTITIHDAAGRQVASAITGDELWPKTEALYFAQLSFPVHGDVGLHAWQARTAGEGLTPAHADGTADFSMRVVGTPEHVVKVEAIDSARHTPLAGAMVTMHPFRAKADENGIAELRVPKGAYRLFVSAPRYVSKQREIDVDGDLSTQAQLDVEVRPERL